MNEKNHIPLSSLIGRLDEDGKEAIDIINGWCGSVARHYNERTLSVELDSNVWGIFDYIGSLYTRDRVEQLLSGLNPNPPHALIVADLLFESFTHEEDVDWSMFGQTRRVGWWWSCVPNSGPVVDDIAFW